MPDKSLHEQLFGGPMHPGVGDHLYICLSIFREWVGLILSWIEVCMA